MFYLKYIIFAKYNLKYRMAFLSAIFATQAIFHTQFADMFIAYLIIKFHLTTTQLVINPLTPNDHYRGRTAPLTSEVAFYIFIQQM